MTVKFLSLILALLCAGISHSQARIFNGYSLQEVKSRIDNIGPSPIEGLWQFTGGGATIAIERAAAPVSPDALPPSFNIILVESPDGSVSQGTLIGTAGQTALSSSFDCYLFKDHNKPEGGRRRFTIRLNDEGHISFLKVKSGISVSLRRWMPYLFRMTVIKRNERNEQLDGCIKLYPVNPSTFNTPRYL